jgi:hypothetical protein
MTICLFASSRAQQRMFGAWKNKTQPFWLNQAQNLGGLQPATLTSLVSWA